MPGQVPDGDHGWMEVVRDCLLVNWFIQSIPTLPTYFPDDARTFWHDNVVPLLELNASHESRLAPDEGRLSVILEAIVRARSHPDKLCGILTAHTCIFYPHKVDWLEELEQRLVDCQETIVALRASISMQDMQARELEATNYRISTLEGQSAALQAQIRSLHRRRQAQVQQEVLAGLAHLGIGDVPLAIAPVVNHASEDTIL